MQRWITNYEREMSFDEFKSKLNIVKEHPKSNRNIESVLDDVNNIIDLF